MRWFVLLMWVWSDSAHWGQKSLTWRTEMMASVHLSSHYTLEYSIFITCRRIMTWTQPPRWPFTHIYNDVQVIEQSTDGCPTKHQTPRDGIFPTSRVITSRPITAKHWMSISGCYCHIFPSYISLCYRDDEDKSKVAQCGVKGIVM